MRPCALVAALADTPEISIAFNRVRYSLAQRTPETDGTIETCRRLNVGVLAAEPLGEEMCVVNEEHPMCDSGQLRLLSFIGAMVGWCSLNPV